MSSATASEEIQCYLQQLMKKEGIDAYETQFEGQPGKGENYLGNVTFLTVVPKNGGDAYNLVVKAAKESKELRSAMPVEIAYKRESYMYRVVFPEFRKFVDLMENGVTLNYIPKVFWICDEDLHETLIMDNLKHKGYQPWDRTKPMNLEHVLMVMKSLGRHHALSLALKDQKADEFSEITGVLTNIWIEFCKYLDPVVFHGALLKDVLEFLRDAGRNDLANKFQPIFDDVRIILANETPEEDRLVICHGDCWNNNLLFKYEGKDCSKPSDICFVDFQMSMLDTPVKDLSYFIYTACDKSTLDQIELILHTYHESLKTCLKQLGSKRDDLFTYHQLKEHWKKYSSFGLVSSPFIVKAELCKSDEAPDLVEITEQRKDISNIFDFKLKDEEEYKRRMIEVFTHYAEQFL
ncbi:hypothetical protein HHI36_012458 [Cryptolaemus montrouzieri]|uniref:CHK kinase-like domain-containing protein n=1 Tax=Cryptolaemus montrouzieri TaxID=559131 RepID=A0ABD2NF40_9CUCU